MNADVQNKDLLSVEGTVDKIIYVNDANGYTVCELLTSAGEILTLVGVMPFLAEGETIEAQGEYVTHPSFGRQFKVEYYEKQLPATESAILKYLSSGVIKGIGPATAKRIVGQYMLDTFDVMENHPEWLADIPGIIEGASQGAGLGIRFLKHIARTRGLLFLIDVSQENYLDSFEILLGELKAFSPELAERRRVILATKMDTEGSEENLKKLIEKYPQEEIHGISVFSGFGMDKIKDIFSRLVLQEE